MFSISSKHFPIQTLVLWRRFKIDKKKFGWMNQLFRNQLQFMTLKEFSSNHFFKFNRRGAFIFKESTSNSLRMDERNVKLGKTLRILQERLPELLQKPLPPEILSPKITLNLFPSTHPHLPSVTGRVAYSAALWTSPIAWGRLPLISNVRLHILSERMIKHARISSTTRWEQLVVRWRTWGNSSSSSSHYDQTSGRRISWENTKVNPNVDKITKWLGSGGDPKEFTGLFIFEFDEEGRLLTHTIEHAQEGGNWENGVGAKVVGLTDWLLGGLKGDSPGDAAPCPAFWHVSSEPNQISGTK